MGTAERRNEIMRILCIRRFETINNLANVFSVSSRTILRDIEILSLTEPIYTKQGKYGGGVYVTENFHMTQMYMKERELTVLKKILDYIDSATFYMLDTDEINILKNLINQYTKPIIKKGK